MGTGAPVLRSVPQAPALRLAAILSRSREATAAGVLRSVLMLVPMALLGNSYHVEIARHNLRLASVSPFARAVRAGWSWWTAELLAMIPERIRGALSGGERLLLEFQGDDLVLAVEGDPSGMTPVRVPVGPGGGGDAGSPRIADSLGAAREIVFCLPPHQVLTKVLTLPAAAQENLREVLAFEMSRQTPFKSDQVYFDYTVLGRDRAARTLSVELVLAPRRAVDERLARCAALGIHPQRVTARRDRTGVPLAVDLARVQGKSLKSVAGRRLDLVLAGIAIVLFLAAVLLPLLSKLREVHGLEPALERAAARARMAGTVRDQADRLAFEAHFLLDKKQGRPSVLEVINEITRILPDHTWLSRLEIKGNEVQVQGESESAAELIPLIESSSLLHNARFRSPVTQNPGSGVERFQLSAEVRQEYGR